MKTNYRNAIHLSLLLIMSLVAGCQSTSPHKDNKKKHHSEEELDERYGTSSQARTHIEHDITRRSGIETAVASSQKIQKAIRIRGRIVPSEHRIAHIIPRFAGIVREGRKTIGDRVEQGEVLAIIESNESLQPFEVRSQISGIVTNGHVAIGEFVPEGQWIYVVTNISKVWADFFVPLRYRPVVQNGQNILISTIDANKESRGKIAYKAPYLDRKTQSQLARVVLSNDDGGDFLPGTYVLGEIIVEEANAKVAVRKESLQSFKNRKVVFIKVGNIYEARPLTIGKHDDKWVEVLEGLSPGDEYVVKNSFLIKADILKSGASHDH